MSRLIRSPLDPSLRPSAEIPRGPIGAFPPANACGIDPGASAEIRAAGIELLNVILKHAAHSDDREVAMLRVRDAVEAGIVAARTKHL